MQTFVTRSFWQCFFDEFAPDYKRVDKTSMGMAPYVRRQALKLVHLGEQDTLADLMCGPGSILPVLPRSYKGVIELVDFSEAMCTIAREDAATHAPGRTRIYVGETAVLLPQLEAQHWLCTFGFKTLLPAERKQFCAAVATHLPQGGRFVAAEFDTGGWLGRLVDPLLTLKTRISALRFHGLMLRDILRAEPESALAVAQELQRGGLRVKTWRHLWLPVRFIVAEKA